MESRSRDDLAKKKAYNGAAVAGFVFLDDHKVIVLSERMRTKNKREMIRIISQQISVTKRDKKTEKEDITQVKRQAIIK